MYRHCQDKISRYASFGLRIHIGGWRKSTGQRVEEQEEKIRLAHNAMRDPLSNCS
jgi:hypothetical protein